MKMKEIGPKERINSVHNLGFANAKHGNSTTKTSQRLAINSIRNTQIIIIFYTEAYAIVKKPGPIKFFLN